MANALNQIIADLKKEQNSTPQNATIPLETQVEAKNEIEMKLITERENLRAIEQEIISNIIKMGPENYENRFHNLFSRTSALLDQLARMPFGKTSSEFHNHPLLEDYFKKCAYYGDFGLWLLIEQFLAATNNKNDMVENHAIQAIAIKLKTLSDEIHRKNGCGIFRLDWEIIRNVYLSNNQKLIHLFAKFLPAPKRNIFSQENLPTFVLECENKSFQEIIKIMVRNDWDFDFVERHISSLQRKFRFKRRMKEERNRISEWLGQKLYKKIDQKISAEEMILDANIPYLPKRCNRKLAIRLYKAAKKVKLFSTVRHLTSPSGLVSIFDDAIYGRRTLKEFYLPFRAAGLDYSDIQNGDGNVICFGPNEIHSNCTPSGSDTVEIIMELDKIKPNPCLFFKQLDLGFPLTRTRKFVLGEKEFFFTHTDERLMYYTNSKHPHFVMYDIAANSESNSKELYAYSALPHASLISYNFRRMHQILALNFFRFIDTLCIISKDSSRFTSEIHNQLINQIYSELDKLSDDKLVSFLEDVGRQLTDTMEFNFYGAYRIDFDSILNINIIKSEYSQSSRRHLTERPFSLNLPQFIEALQKGNLEVLQEARTKLPNLFKSYRFVNYLISKKPASSVLHELRDQNQFILPFYMQKLPEKDKRKIKSKKQKEHDKQYALIPWKPKQRI